MIPYYSRLYVDLVFHRKKTICQCLFLDTCVVDFAEEILIGLGQFSSVFSEPDGKHEEVTGKKNSQNTAVINTKPFISSFSGERCAACNKSGDGAGNLSNEVAALLGSH